MNIVQITPGAGGMYCGGCFRDNALVGALRKLGHEVVMVPLYLPLTLDEADNSAGAPIFFGGINVYLQQKSVLFRKAPRWLHSLLDSPSLLKWASGSAAKTRAQDVGALTLSMARGEEGRQERELNELIAWLKSNQRPDVICLSNALLIGLARRIKHQLQVPIVCLLTGEDSFLDSLPPEYRQLTWQTLSERATDIDLFVAPSIYYRDLMARRLNISASQMRVVHNGINLEGYTPAKTLPSSPVLGYFARMCTQKGLDTLAEAYILICKRGRIANLKLRVGGGMGPTDKPLVDSLRQRFDKLGLGETVEFCPNLDRDAKQEFYRSLSVFCVPALYGEAFGLYIIEALAAGVPVVQPRHGAFPELIEATGGGVVCEPNPEALASALERLLLDPIQSRALGEAGRSAVFQRFGIEHMAEAMATVYRELQKAERAPIGNLQSAI
jgi:glycosyltransferase involved in cell wall biosynthesis